LLERGIEHLDDKVLLGSRQLLDEFDLLLQTSAQGPA